MRASTLTVCFTILCLAAAPVVAAPPEPDRTAEHAVARKPASAGELDQYAQRERTADKQREFHGGRGRGIEAGTLIIILLVVILVVLIV